MPRGNINVDTTANRSCSVSLLCFKSFINRESQIISFFSQFQEMLTFHISLNETCVMGKSGVSIFIFESTRVVN